MEDEINRILSRAESKFCDPYGKPCTSKTVGLLSRRHIVAGEFHYIGKEASTRWAGGVDLSMMSEAGALDPADETLASLSRECEHSRTLCPLLPLAPHPCREICTESSDKWPSQHRCAPNGRVCTPKTVGLLARRHIVAGEFHYIGKEASTRWGGGPDPSMLVDAGALNPTDETCREYERVVDAKYLGQIRADAKEFSNKLLSRLSGVARSAIMNFKKGRNTIKPRTLRKLIKAIHDLQNNKSC